MDMSMMHDEMGGMDMGGDGSNTVLNSTGVDFSNYTQASAFLGEILDDTEFQIDGNRYARIFWYGIVALIVGFAIANMIQRLQARSRLRAATRNRPLPARPSNLATNLLATLAAMHREIFNAQLTPASPRAANWFKVPPVGICVLVVSHFAWVILLEFVDNTIEGAQHFTSLGVRAGWLGVAQVPLLILLAGKNNLIGFVSGISYERLNVLHRWTARVLLFLVTLHMLFLHLAWNAYDLGSIEYSTDSCIPTGWATYALLLWMNLSTLAPLRNWSYEFFIVQHLLTWVGFLVAVMYHLPSTALYSRVYIFIPIGIYFLDRVIRSLRYAYNNVRPARATLTAMDGGVTKIRVKSRQIRKWTPGSHVFLSIPKFGIAQSHPATIASVPDSHNGDLVFILKGHRGFTGRLLEDAITSSTTLPSNQKSEEDAQPTDVSHFTLIDGPYGASHADFATFDTSILIAGSTGITFTLPILLDLAARAKKTKLPLQRLRFIWIVKNTSWTSWISSELKSASTDLRSAGIETLIDVFVTCDKVFAGDDDANEGAELGCNCDKSLGPCCCVTIAESTDGEDSVEKQPVVLESRLSSRGTGSSSSQLTGVSSRILPCALFHSGRPDFRNMLWDSLDRAHGETGVAVCGSLGLSAAVRRTVVWCSDQRGVHKGSGAQGIYLHAECFGW